MGPSKLKTEFFVTISVLTRRPCSKNELRQWEAFNILILFFIINNNVLSIIFKKIYRITVIRNKKTVPSGIDIIFFSVKSFLGI